MWLTVRKKCSDGKLRESQRGVYFKARQPGAAQPISRSDLETLGHMHGREEKIDGLILTETNLHMWNLQGQATWLLVTN